MGISCIISRPSCYFWHFLSDGACIRFQHLQEKQRSENVIVIRAWGIHNDHVSSYSWHCYSNNIAKLMQNMLQSWKQLHIELFSSGCWNIQGVKCRVSTKTLTLRARQDFADCISSLSNILVISRLKLCFSYNKLIRWLNCIETKSLRTNWFIAVRYKGC